MSACSAGCQTPGAHATWGECVKAKALRIGGCRSVDGVDTTAMKASDRELELYASARSQGIQPRTTKTPDIRQAIEVSDRTGSAFKAG